MILMFISHNDYKRAPISRNWYCKSIFKMDQLWNGYSSFLPFQHSNHWPWQFIVVDFHAPAHSRQRSNVWYETWKLYRDKQQQLQRLPRSRKERKNQVDNENTVGLHCLVADRQEQWSWTCTWFNKAPTWWAFLLGTVSLQPSTSSLHEDFNTLA